MGHILVVDDDPAMLQLIRRVLEKDQHLISLISDARTALNMNFSKYDLILLDIMMPGLDGYRVLRNIREQNNIPVIMLSAKDTDADKILGLDLGADDYITKPFGPLEAVARVNSNIRRFYSLGARGDKKMLKELTVQDLRLDLEACVLYRGGEEIELTSVEFRIMKLFMEEPGKVFTKQQLYEQGWGDEYLVSDNNIMVCISKLRAKLDKEGKEYIKTIRGLGYRMEK